MKKIFVMTDLEGVAGVVNFEDWCAPASRYYDLAKELLTQEINAAVEGFFAGGAEAVHVADGHGAGAIHPHMLDPRVTYQRGWGVPAWPLGLDKTYDGLAFIGQHGKAGSHYAHIAHSQSFNYINIAVNGVSIGEFGQLAMCASELGVRTIFATGDYALSLEAQALVPGIETVWIKKGLKAITGEDLNRDDYSRLNLSATHFPPKKAREMIRAGAEKAVRRANQEDFGIIPLKRPIELTATLRPDDKWPCKRAAKFVHPESVAGALNAPWMANLKPVVEEK